jgi:hypothetical protein
MTLFPRSPTDVSLQYSVTVGELKRDKTEALAVWRDGGFLEHAAGDSARFDWFYQENPAGHGQLSLLHCDSGPPVGVLGTCPRQFAVNGRLILAGVLVDFVVHPAHRTALPALLLQKAARARAAESMAILYGLPDKKAVAIFKRLGHTVHFELPRYARVLQTRPFFARIMPTLFARPVGLVLDGIDAAVLRSRIFVRRWINTGCGNMQSAWTDNISDDFDRLWTDFAKESLCIGVRDAGFLRWRFGRKPGFSYRIFTVSCKSTKRLCAYFICEIIENGIVIKDCLSLGGRAEWLHALDMLCLEARQLRTPALYIDIAAPEHVTKAFLSAGFIRRSARPFFATVGDLAPARTAWYITQADEDI